MRAALLAGALAVAVLVASASAASHPAHLPGYVTSVHGNGSLDCANSRSYYVYQRGSGRNGGWICLEPGRVVP